LAGLGDAASTDPTTTDPNAQTAYTSDEGFTSFSNADLTTAYDPNANPVYDAASNYGPGVQAAGQGVAYGAQQLAKGLGNLLPTIPWWVWVGGAGLLYLAWHHEFKRG
jgi:hypothetical protein